MININLLPPELKLKRIAAKKNASIFSVCLVIVVFFIVLGVVTSSAKTTIESRLGIPQTNPATSKKTLDGTRTLENLALSINDRAKMAKEISNSKASWSQILLELANGVPVQMKFETLTADTTKSPNLTVEGITNSDKEITKIKEKLEGSNFFKNVTANNIKFEDGSFTFSLTFDLEKKTVAQQGAR